FSIYFKLTLLGRGSFEFNFSRSYIVLGVSPSADYSWMFGSGSLDWVAGLPYWFRELAPYLLPRTRCYRRVVPRYLVWHRHCAAECHRHSPFRPGGWPSPHNFLEQWDRLCCLLNFHFSSPALAFFASRNASSGKRAHGRSAT